MSFSPFIHSCFRSSFLPLTYQMRTEGSLKMQIAMENWVWVPSFFTYMSSQITHLTLNDKRRETEWLSGSLTSFLLSLVFFSWSKQTLLILWLFFRGWHMCLELSKGSQIDLWQPGCNATNFSKSSSFMVWFCHPLELDQYKPSLDC